MPWASRHIARFFFKKLYNHLDYSPENGRAKVSPEVVQVVGVTRPMKQGDKATRSTGKLATALLPFLIVARPAQAYLDPGTGSMILQALIGAIAGGLVVVRIYWRKIVSFFGRRSGKDNDEPA